MIQSAIYPWIDDTICSCIQHNLFHTIYATQSVHVFNTIDSRQSIYESWIHYTISSTPSVHLFSTIYSWRDYTMYSTPSIQHNLFTNRGYITQHSLFICSTQSIHESWIDYTISSTHSVHLFMKRLHNAFSTIYSLSLSLSLSLSHTHTHTHTHTRTQTQSVHVFNTIHSRQSIYESWIHYTISSTQSVHPFNTIYSRIIGLFCRISSLLQVSFAKETYHFKEPTSRSHHTIYWLSINIWPISTWCMTYQYLYGCMISMNTCIDVFHIRNMFHIRNIWHINTWYMTEGYQYMYS